MRKMLMLSLSSLFAVAAAGCSSGGTEVTRIEATDAALASYPSNMQASDERQLAAVVHPQREQIELLNMSNTALPAGNVWINGRFVHRAPAIPARSSVTLDFSRFIEAGPSVLDLSQAKSDVQSVEVETNEGLFSVQGPVRK